MHENSWYTDTLWPSWYQAERDWWVSTDVVNGVNPTGVDWSTVDASWGTTDIKNRVFGTGAGASPGGYMVQSMDGTGLVSFFINFFFRKAEQSRMVSKIFNFFDISNFL